MPGPNVGPLAPGGVSAPLVSPVFTGTPAAPTPAYGDNTTKLATTAFVKAALGAEVITAVNLTLTAAHNYGRISVATTGLTITIPAAATLGFFECEVIADGFAVILDGPGATNVTVADGEVAHVVIANSKSRVYKTASVITS